MTVNLTIDGTQVEVDEGTTVLAAAQSLGKDIPTLCHNDELKPYGSCFLCVVQIAGRPNLVPSCTTACVDNMEVNTDSEDIRGARKVAAHLRGI